MAGQGELNFSNDANEQGYTQWLAGRKVAAVELARRINLDIKSKSGCVVESDCEATAPQGGNALHEEERI